MSSAIAHGGSAATEDLPGLLGRWAAQDPDGVAVNHLDFSAHSGGAQTSWTWRDLDARVGAVAAWLQRRIGKGEPVAVLIGQTPDYIAAFLGALRAGAAAVPLFTPDLPGHGDRLASVLRDCAAGTVLTTQDSAPAVAAFIETHRLPVGQVVCVDTLPTAIAAHFEPVALAPADLAYLQYTSGSTGDPRGVMITHGNVIANARQAVRAYNVRRESVTVSWLPLFHDMGLVLSVAAPMMVGIRTVLMDPLAFIERPERWLRALSANPVAVTAAPNFAYAYCAARVSDWEKSRLRLENVGVLIDGSEPVLPGIIDRFHTAFAGCGLRPEAHRPSYGLAEATVFVSASTPDRPAVVRHFERTSLAAGKAVEVSADAEDVVALVSCGQPIDQGVLVVDPKTGQPRPEGEVGEIWVAGPNVGQGYWKRPQESARAFHNAVSGVDAPDGPWLATGDLGMWCDGELYITGRIKDLIVVDGRNHYPHDVERTAEGAHASIRPRNVVAFSVSGPDGEQAVVVAERAKTVAPEALDRAEVDRAVRAAVAERHGLALREVRVVEPDSLPRTSSGKISRTACRERYLTTVLTETGPA
ncbi:fatty acyl-AMP ligase [Actinokineospora iranica]|uniref:Acyl-CoA synthetase (AMP-forming)/AMP-acid ligase II n=1 Tax=Actinokineospora iranica TaxID=1271860 RepID=A0A1G6Z996_9PSEU|nr:fatty acyl-AMP ligase [Actinokineospora iranica]SDD99314.1 Acyl-CoA synthetase (AMP-forming)/AMP-acid ligase II [Actinokineospora iranica]